MKNLRRKGADSNFNLGVHRGLYTTSFSDLNKQVIDLHFNMQNAWCNTVVLKSAKVVLKST